ncbi:MAG: 1-phosphofructokinase family hexose kinase [Rubrivivax sp.]|nr:1-phosphofructokinase family hexose kinase [Rubrivivax sp.]
MSRVITVTLNPAIDLTVRVDHLVPGQVHRARGQHSEAGGKGIGVAAVLAALGVPVAAAGWLGADNAGLFEAAFAQRGITDLMQRLPGATRTNIKLADAHRGDSTDINLPGLALGADDIDTALSGLVQRLQTELQPGDWCEMAGSLPPGVQAGAWVRIAQAVKARGAHLAVDTGGTTLAALLPALAQAGTPPAFIKPNQAELEELTGRPLPTQAEVQQAAQALLAQGLDAVVVSQGGEGALIVSAQGCWQARPPRVPVATTVGAGDAMVAGTLAARIEGRPWPDAAVFGMACAAGRIQRIAPQLPPRNEIERLAAAVSLQPL